MMVRGPHRTMGALVAFLFAVAACGPTAASPSPSPASQAPATSPSPSPPPEIGKVTWLSTQLRPVEEAEKVRSKILAGFGGEVDFVPEDEGPFQDRIRAEVQAGSGSVDLLGALHGNFVSLQEFGALTDLGAVASRIPNINKGFLDLGRLGTDKQLFVPWMQATYIMVASKEALQYLPEGADVNALTYDQLAAWGRNIKEATGLQKIGLPLGERGLFHRFMQGYAYPSFTGTEVVGFKSDEAVAMYDTLKAIWESVHPQAQTYEFMQEPLLSGEVWIAWDHVARLIEALRQRPDDFVAFPAPAGPKGRGFMPVLAGLAIPPTAPNRAGAEALIEWLLRPETQLVTLQQVAFFPVIDGVSTTDLEAGVKLEADAVNATQSAPDALPALLPVGIGDKGGEWNKAYRDAFTRIVINGEDARTVLEAEAANLQGILDAKNAACWPPDPPSDGACQIK